MKEIKSTMLLAKVNEAHGYAARLSDAGGLTELTRYRIELIEDLDGTQELSQDELSYMSRRVNHIGAELAEKCGAGPWSNYGHRYTDDDLRISV